MIEQIKSGDPAWSDHVPAEVAEVIRRRGLLGHRRAATPKENPAQAPAIAPSVGGFIATQTATV